MKFYKFTILFISPDQLIGRQKSIAHMFAHLFFRIPRQHRPHHKPSYFMQLCGTRRTEALATINPEIQFSSFSYRHTRGADHFKIFSRFFFLPQNLFNIVALTHHRREGHSGSAPSCKRRGEWKETISRRIINCLEFKIIFFMVFFFGSSGFFYKFPRNCSVDEVFWTSPRFNFIMAPLSMCNIGKWRLTGCKKMDIEGFGGGGS